MGVGEFEPEDTLILSMGDSSLSESLAKLMGLPVILTDKRNAEDIKSLR